MKTLKYQDKIKYAKEMAILMEKQGDVQSFKNLLKEEKDLLNTQIEAVKKSAIKIFHKNVGMRIRQHLIDQNLEDHLDDFDCVDADLFEELQHQEIANIKRIAQAETNKLLRKKVSAEEIHERVKNPYFNMEDVLAQIEAFKYKNDKVQGGEKRRYIGLGVLGVLLGSSLLILRILFSGQLFKGEIIIYGGMFVFGVINFRRAFMTKAEIDDDQYDFNEL